MMVRGNPPLSKPVSASGSGGKELYTVLRLTLSRKPQNHLHLNGQKLTMDW